MLTDLKWTPWLRKARDHAKQWDLYREQFAVGASPQAGVDRIRLKLHGIAGHPPPLGEEKPC